MELGNLVISRRVGERIFIGEHIVVEVVESRRGRAKLKVTAPRNVGVWRYSEAEREAYFATNGGEGGGHA